MSDKKSPFRIPSPKTGQPSDPEALFRDLKHRSPDVQHIWSHQADLLRSYHSHHIETTDVALELPTGTGKTLIGLLIAEWRRRTREERVIYLCPTKQLAYQVGNQAKSSYGIDVSVLVGRQNEYDEDSYAQYLKGNRVAITTYSGVFNTNPRLCDGNALILDDAHSSENYIASLWTVDIDRTDNADCYFGLLDILATSLRASLLEALRQHDRSDAFRSPIDKVPLPYLAERMDQVRQFIDEKLQGNSRYSWSVIREHLLACNVYVAWPRITLRPLVPPTLTHRAFAGATQRLYMSATIGEGGELERITGVRQIARLPVPPGWERQGTGRKLILFPNHSLDDQEAHTVTARIIRSVDRALVLAPNKMVAERFMEKVGESLGDMAILTAPDIEESLEPFTASSNSVLLLTSRYDGLDLPGETCRLEVIAGLPGATSAQEQFMLARLGAYSLLQDRIRTRLSQAVGRCTRNATDYAAILFLGDDLLQFCSRKEVRSGLHPELQAEFQFGLDNSAVETSGELEQRVTVFLQEREQWEDAENAIQALRDSMEKHVDPVAETLFRIAPQEVDFSYHLFSGNIDAALQDARAISDALSGDALRPYRAWWYYLSGSLAWLRAKAGVRDAARLAKDMFTRASETALAVSWFSELATREVEPATEIKADAYLSFAAEGIYDQLVQLGFVGSKFERAMKQFESQIMNEDPEEFDQGLKLLGDYLGFDAEHPDDNAAPDSVWSLSDTLLLLEAKSNESPDGEIGVDTCRQASGHLKWAGAHRKGFRDIRVSVISPRTQLDKKAAPHAEQVLYSRIANVRELAKGAVSLLRQVRAESVEIAVETTRDNIRKKLLQERLDPRTVLKSIAGTRLLELLKTEASFAGFGAITAWAAVVASHGSGRAGP